MFNFGVKKCVLYMRRYSCTQRCVCFCMHVCVCVDAHLQAGETIMQNTNRNDNRNKGGDTLKRCVVLSHHAVASPHWVSIGLLLHGPICSQTGWGDATAASIQTQWCDATTRRGSTMLVAASLVVRSKTNIGQFLLRVPLKRKQEFYRHVHLE